MIKVRIDKCENANYWYNGIVGNTFSVSEDGDNYLLFGVETLAINKSDCTEIADDLTKTVEHVWIYPIGTYNKDSEQFSAHTKHGMTLNDSSEDDSDLFLIPKIETVWVNIWHTFLDSKLESEIDSKKNKFNSRFVKTIEIKKPIE